MQQDTDQDSIFRASGRQRRRHGRPPVRRLIPWLAVNASLMALPATVAQTEGDGPSGDMEYFKSLSLEDLMNIEVTSVSRRVEKLSETASAIQVVTGEDIRRSGASSIPEALRLAHNLQVAQKDSHSWGITARGFNADLGNKLLVLMDGRTVYTPLYSGVFWERQDYLLEDIERIEVISGPGSTLWGANAVNGVINIISKSSKDTQGLHVEGGGGSELRGFAGMRYGGTLASNVTYRVYGKYFDRDSAVFANGNDAMDEWDRGQGGFRVDAEAGGGNQLTFQGDFYAGNQQSVVGEGKVSGGNLLGRWTHTFSEESDLSLQFYYDRTHLDTPTAPYVIGTTVLAPAGRLVDDLDTYDLDFQHRLQAGERNRFVWGLGYRFTHDDVGNSPSVSFYPAVLDQHMTSGFVQDEIMLRDNLFFTLGTKLEHNEYTGLEFAPSARVLWNITEGQALWAAVSRAVRTPSRIDRDLSQPAAGLVVLRGGRDFESENVIAYELGHRAQIGKRTAASVSLFYNVYDDVRSTGLTPVTVVPFYFENNVEGDTYGAEFSISYQPLDWWRLGGGYTLLRQDLRIEPGKTDFNNALNEVADPQHQFSLSSSMDLPRNVGFDARFRWVDSLQHNNGPNVGTLPGYAELSLRLSWRPADKLEVSIVGQNLLHDQHPEYGFPSPARVEIERSVYGKLAWQF